MQQPHGSVALFASATGEEEEEADFVEDAEEDWITKFLMQPTTIDH